MINYHCDQCGGTFLKRKLNNILIIVNKNDDKSLL